MRALVVFNDGSTEWPRLFMRAGFNHVFCCILTGRGWIKVEGVGAIPTVQFVCRADFDLKAFYEEQGWTAVDTKVNARRPLRPTMVAGSCLGLTKSFLGIGRPWIVTPHQLYSHLMKGSPHGRKSESTRPATPASGPRGPGDRGRAQETA